MTNHIFWPQSCLTCDSLGAAAALLGEHVTVAVGAVRLLVLGRELLLGELLVAVGAGETLAVPRHVLVGHAPLVDHLGGAGTDYYYRMFIIDIEL